MDNMKKIQHYDSNAPCKKVEYPAPGILVRYKEDKDQVYQGPQVSRIFPSPGGEQRDHYTKSRRQEDDQRSPKITGTGKHEIIAQDDQKRQQMHGREKQVMRHKVVYPCKGQAINYTYEGIGFENDPIGPEAAIDMCYR
jgi:hypothetical protein